MGKMTEQLIRSADRTINGTNVRTINGADGRLIDRADGRKINDCRTIN